METPHLRYCPTPPPLPSQTATLMCHVLSIGGAGHPIPEWGRTGRWLLLYSKWYTSLSKGIYQMRLSKCSPWFGSCHGLILKLCRKKFKNVQKYIFSYLPGYMHKNVSFIKLFLLEMAFLMWPFPNKFYWRLQVKKVAFAQFWKCVPGAKIHKNYSAS